MNKKIIKITSTFLLATMVAYTTPILAFTKEETVYSKTKNNGEVYQTIVSTHLKNGDEENILKDLTDLINIENTNGDETYSLDGEELTWNADGSDIYYQGESQKELPIKSTISYELDGEEISAEELVGKSGKVKITIQYENEDAHEMYINGTKQTLYTPFTVACGTIFSNTENKNIEITNGKVVNDGTKTMVLGIAMPGMQESLNISNTTIEIPDKVEITMETTKFEQNNIITFVTPKIFDENFSFDKLDEIYSKVNTLQDSANQLEEGANTLKEGMETYVEKSTEFSTAMDTFENGMSTATSGYTAIYEGIEAVNENTTALKDGASKVDAGVDAVNSGLQTLKAGVTQGKATATSTLSESATELSNGIDTIITGKDTEIETIKEKVIDGANTELASNLKTALLSTNLNLTTAQISALNSIIDTAIETTSTTQKAGLDTINDSAKGVKAGLNSLKTQAGESITEGIKQISDGFDDITNGIDKAIAGTTTLKAGTNQLANGTTQLEAGINTLATGSTKLKTGINQLNTSTKQLNSANKQLLAGANELKDGTITLADGMSKFNKEGITTICNYINGDLKDITTRVEKLQELSEQYTNFTKANEGTAESVKFILITDSIKEKEETESN